MEKKLFSEDEPALSVSPVELSEALTLDSPDWSEVFGHKTVMGAEALEFLNIKPNGVYIDGTMGGGGHSRMILSALSGEGRLVAVDQDAEARRWATEAWGRNEKRLSVVAANFVELDEVFSDLALDGVDGILLDLGLSSRQLESPGRGFSWARDEALDMRLDPDASLTAEEIVNRYSEKALADVIWRYGEERASRRIARGIVWARSKKPLTSTSELASVIRTSLWRPGPPPRIHPATRTFMALRIEVNSELKVLDSFLKKAPALLNDGGRLVVISFHSLEDRLVKEAFRLKNEMGVSVWRALSKKPLTPGLDEISENPRSRSAKLRAAEKF